MELVLLYAQPLPLELMHSLLHSVPPDHRSNILLVGQVCGAVVCSLVSGFFVGHSHLYFPCLGLLPFVPFSVPMSSSFYHMFLDWQPSASSAQSIVSSQIWYLDELVHLLVSSSGQHVRASLVLFLVSRSFSSYQRYVSVLS